MGKQKGKRHLISRIPPHRGSVILTDKQAHRMKVNLTVGMLTAMALELAPNCQKVRRATLELNKVASRER
jgi:hypothetical protein